MNLKKKFFLYQKVQETQLYQVVYNPYGQKKFAHGIFKFIWQD